jgi:cyclase
MRRRSVVREGAVLAGLLAGALALSCQAAEPLAVEKLTERLSLVTGAGGNVTVLAAEGGLLVVDSGTKEAADALQAKLVALNAGPVRYLVVTHHHFDHVGGNAVVGQGAEIVAHERARETGATEADAAGVTRYTDEKTLRMGAQEVRLRHFGPGHTSGDTVVVFAGEKVVVVGDLFFNGLPPYIDVAHGADTGRWIAVIEKLAKEYADFRVVPGHGPVSDMAGYLRFAAYLKALREKVAAAVAAGKTREQAMESISLDEFPAVKDASFLRKRDNVGWVYDEMTRK